MTEMRTVLPAATSAPAGGLGPVQHIRNALKSAPLLVNGYAMVASTGLTSLIGMVFWMAATHFYDQQQVGLGAALIAAMSAISYFGQLNLSTVLNRFLPTAGAHAASLIVKAYIAAGLVSGTIALCFALGIGTFAAPLSVLKDDPLTTTIFVFATVIWSVFALQDAALSGLRLSVVIPFENTAYALLKIAFLVSFAFMATTPANGIYLGWTLALVPTVLVVNVLIFRHLAIRKVSGKSNPVDLKAVFHFLSWDYAGSIFLTAAFGLAPLMITSVAGVEANAPYHIAWTFTYSIYLIGRSMGISLLAESATYPQRIRRLTADTFCHTMLLVSAAVAVLWIAAPFLLELFGAVYVAQSTSILRVLVLACLPWAATTTFIAALRAMGQTKWVAAIQLATLIIFTVSSALLLPRIGALGVAYGWLIANSLVLAGFLAMYLARAQSASIPDHGLLLASSLANIARNIIRRLFRPTKASPERIPGEKTSIGEFDLSSHQPLRTPSSATDCTTMLLTRKTSSPGPGNDPISAVVKFSDTLPGIAALQRNAQTLNDLHSDHRLQNLKHRLPEILGQDQSGGVFRTVETAMPGQDGRSIFSDHENVESASNSVVVFVSRLHEMTAQPLTLTPTWAERWIDEPVDTVTTVTRSRWGAENRAAALECLREDLRRVLIGRTLPLGRGHGDLCPGNVLLTRSGDTPAEIEVSGLVDWDNSRDDAPLALDLYHLALTARMIGSGEELGQVTRSCILESRFDINDIIGFPLSTSIDLAADREDREFHRAMLLLMWLHHVRSNLVKSERYSGNWLWTRSNVDRVLGAIVTQTG